MTAYNIKDGKLVWRGYSMGPDSDTLIDPVKTTALGKPVGKDSGTNTGRAISGRSAAEHLGLVFLRSRAEPDLLRIGQPLDLESEAAAG